MSIRHGGPRPRRCAGGGIRGVINNVGCRGGLLITRTAHCGVTCICDTEHRMLAQSINQSKRIYIAPYVAGDAIVEPIATMRV